MILSLPLKANIYLIRPTTNSWLGFGGMHEKTFAEAYNKKVLLNKNQLEDFQKLWNIYSQKEEGDLMTSGIKLKSLIPRIENVLQAQLDREDGKNRPLESLKRILTESEDHSFSTVFKAFSKKEGIYGFGDTSIKKMYDELMKS